MARRSGRTTLSTAGPGSVVVLVDHGVPAAPGDQRAVGRHRIFNHAPGHAVDIWAFDGIPVIDQARTPWKDAMNAAAATGATEVGGLVDPDVRPFFSDAAQQDHLHIGFDGP